MAKLKRTDSSQLLFPEITTPKEAFRSMRNYLAGQFVGATRDDTLLDEVLKCMFCKLYQENKKAPPIPYSADSVTFAKESRKVFSLVRSDFPEIYSSNTEILLDPDSIKFVFQEAAFSLLDAATDPIADAFEVFAGSEARGRAGQFFSPKLVTDLLVEALDPKPQETVVDPACGVGTFLSSVIRYHERNGRSRNAIAKIAKEKIYGIDKDEYLTQLAKMHVALLSGGYPNIFCADSIALENGEPNFRSKLPEEGFDVLLTNPPFGVKIVAARDSILRTFQLARKWKKNEMGVYAPTSELASRVPPQVLFIERSLSLLREGGRMGIIVPESLLSNKSYRHVMEFLFAAADVKAVIGMPEALFKTSGKGGTHTKTCLVVAVKHSKKRTETIFMAEAKWCGHDSRARTIPNNDLPEIASNLNLYQNGKPVQPSPLGFVMNKSKLLSNVLSPRYYDPQLEKDIELLAKSHNFYVFGDLLNQKVLSISTGDELGKLAYGTGDIPFIRTSDISNWEIKADAKHGVDRKLYERLKNKQDVQPLDILMVKDGTYLIGTCAIVSEADREILYQSHLYKIRVMENPLGIDPYLLIATLSSPLVLRQIKSKQFTQDIIDSLGERIKELVLPIPKSANARSNISSIVKDAVKRRVEARELAKKARELVGAS
jgi:type I restriction enzyme M protein